MTAIPLPESADLQRRMEARRAAEGAGYCQRQGCGLPASAGTHDTCAACLAGRGRCNDDDCHMFFGLARSSAVPSPPEAMRVVNLIRAAIERRRHTAYIAATQADADEELARGIATAILLTFDMKEKA